MKTFKELKEQLEQINELDVAAAARKIPGKEIVKQTIGAAKQGIKKNKGKLAAAAGLAAVAAAASPTVRRDVDAATDVPVVKQAKDTAARAGQEGKQFYRLMKSNSPGSY